MSDRRNAATYRALTGTSPRTEPRFGFDASLSLFVRMLGSQQRAADALGVPRRTLRRWVAGESKPRADRRAQVEGVARRIIRGTRINARRQARMRAAATIRIIGSDRYDGQERDVTFRVGLSGATSGLAAGTPGELVDAFLAGVSADDLGLDAQNSGLFARIIRGMTDTSGFYQEFFSSTAPDWGVDVVKVVLS